MSVSRRDVHWLADPEDQHVQAAEAFLTLVGLPDQARRLVAAMLAAPNIDYTAKDLIRATRLGAASLGPEQPRGLAGKCNELAPFLSL